MGARHPSGLETGVTATTFGIIDVVLSAWRRWSIFARSLKGVDDSGNSEKYCIIDIHAFRYVCTYVSCIHMYAGKLYVCMHMYLFVSMFPYIQTYVAAELSKSKDLRFFRLNAPF